jgi:hypothetical protein
METDFMAVHQIASDNERHALVATAMNSDPHYLYDHKAPLTNRH